MKAPAISISLLVVLSAGICSGQEQSLSPGILNNGSYLNSLDQKPSNRLPGSLTSWKSGDFVVPENFYPENAGNPWDASKDLQRMRKGKWVVVSVQRDGKRHPAQVGQEVGDIITLEQKWDNGDVIFG